MKAEMNEIERNGTCRSGRSLAHHASMSLKFSSNINPAMTFRPISTAC
jgi:hypothetical protein